MLANMSNIWSAVSSKSNILYQDQLQTNIEMTGCPAFWQHPSSIFSDNGDLWRHRLEVGWVGRSPKSARAQDAAPARRLRDPGESLVNMYQREYWVLCRVSKYRLISGLTGLVLAVAQSQNKTALLDEPIPNWSNKISAVLPFKQKVSIIWWSIEIIVMV